MFLFEDAHDKKCFFPKKKSEAPLTLTSSDLNVEWLGPVAEVRARQDLSEEYGPYTIPEGVVWPAVKICPSYGCYKESWPINTFPDGQYFFHTCE